MFKKLLGGLVFILVIVSVWGPSANPTTASSTSLTTGFVDDSGWAAGPLFDITASTDVMITGFDMYFKGTLNRDVSVYYKAGTYVGSEATPGDWTLLGTVNVTPGGDGTATFVNLGGVTILAGETYGFKVWDNLGTGGVDGGGLLLDISPPSHSNADIALFTNAYSLSTIWELSGGLIAGWQGTIYYEHVIPVVDDGMDDYSKIGQVKVTAPGSALYESAGGGVVRDAAGQEIWVPNPTAYDTSQDTYDVLAQQTIDGKVWVEIFVGDADSTVWLPVGGAVSPIYQ